HDGSVRFRLRPRLLSRGSGDDGACNPWESGSLLPWCLESPRGTAVQPLLRGWPAVWSSSRTVSPGQPHRGVPPPGYQVPPPMPPPGPAGCTPPRRSSTGLILGLFSASLALVVVVVTLVLVTSSPATRISDLDAVHEVIEERYERHPFLGVGGFEGKHTIDRKSVA